MEAVRIQPKTSSPTAVGAPFSATVVAARNGSVTVKTGQHQFPATPSASCLLRPAPGDRALVAIVDEQCWILAILERTAGEPAIIGMDCDLTVESSTGAVRIAGHGPVDISSSDKIGLQAPEIGLTARLGRIVTGHLSWIGDQFEGRFEGVRLIGRLFDSVVERFSRKSLRSYRETAETDQLRCGDLDYQAEENMSLNARNVLARASKLAKLDGDQIHLG
jgi:hypothetical protein